MLTTLRYLCLFCLSTTFSAEDAATPARFKRKVIEDLQVVGSDDHYNYQQQQNFYQPINVKHPIQFPVDGNFYGLLDRTNFPAPVNVNYPVRTVQRYTDSDGTVKVVTSYSNRDDNPFPIYKDDSLKIMPGVPKKKRVGYQGTYRMTTPPNPITYKAYSVQTEKTKHPVNEVYTKTNQIRFPDDDGELVTNEHERTQKDGNSSAYNQHTSYNKVYSKPVTSRITEKVEEEAHRQPIEGASSNYLTGIDESPDDEYINTSGNYGHGGYEQNSYVGPQNIIHPYRPVLPIGPIIQPVGPGPLIGGGGGSFGKGKSYSHSQHEVKGDRGGKGHRKHEIYNKGHSEKHGHEENKGGQVVENGEKTGHHDEENHFVKGQTTSGGHKGSSLEQSKGHKKGHKTTGFRSVHHKDEYKKDEVFYDEEHDAGTEKNHGEDETLHKHTEGGKNKKGHLNSGYKDAQKGFHGDKEEGHSYDSSKGHAGHEGHHSHDEHSSEYNKGSGHAEGEIHGNKGGGFF